MEKIEKKRIMNHVKSEGTVSKNLRRYNHRQRFTFGERTGRSMRTKSGNNECISAKTTLGRGERQGELNAICY